MSMGRNQSGFTLVEVIVSLFVIGIAIGAVSTLFTSIQSTQKRTANMESATRAAQRQMESMRNNNYNNLTPGQNIDFTSQLPTVLHRRSGTVVVSQPTDGLKRIDITVDYYEGTKKKTVKLSSLVGILGIKQ